MKRETVEITTADGRRNAIAPVVISASRSTDIPAFHAQWLLRRFAAGYCKWVNPFNRRAQYVSFQNARAFVFWSKDPEPLMPYLDTFDRAGIAYYFQFTLNDYESDGLEPHVPPLQERIATFQRLSRQLGRERVIWRFDPLVLTDTIHVGTLLEKVQNVSEQLQDYTQRLVISFVDLGAYAKVRRNVGRWGCGVREPDVAEVQDICAGVSEMARRWGMSVATCCEEVDVSRYGIGHNKCIDDGLLLKISNNDPQLLRFLRPQRIGGIVGGHDSPSRKDPGQRANCGCIASKDIGAYSTCPHLCVYCYANTSPEAVRNKLTSACNDDEALCPKVTVSVSRTPPSGVNGRRH